MTKYVGLIYSLLPFGKAWTRNKLSNLYKLVSAVSKEFQRVEDRSNVLLQENDPFFSSELLADFERVFGLPDDCSKIVSPSTIERQSQVVEKMVRLGGQSKAFLISALAKLGYTITITEYANQSFQVGKSRVGQALTNGAWLHHFVVNTDVDESKTFQVGRSKVGEALTSYNAALLECTIAKLKPANTTVTFNYT